MNRNKVTKANEGLHKLHNYYSRNKIASYEMWPQITNKNYFSTYP